MSMSRWEPFKEMMTLRQAMDRLFEDSFVRSPRGFDGGNSYVPIDVYTTKDVVVIRASVPGAKPDEVEITVEGSTVTIRGEIKASQEEGTFLLQEQRYGPFTRSIDLAIPVQPDKAEAKFENGVLTLTVPKAEEIKPKVIKVKTAGVAQQVRVQQGERCKRPRPRPVLIVALSWRLRPDPTHVLR